jgi:hypothetical protein
MREGCKKGERVSKIEMVIEIVLLIGWLEIAQKKEFDLHLSANGGAL